MVNPNMMTGPLMGVARTSTGASAAMARPRIPSHAANDFVRIERIIPPGVVSPARQAEKNGRDLGACNALCARVLGGEPTGSDGQARHLSLDWCVF
jgi:hypothetical protein